MREPAPSPQSPIRVETWPRLVFTQAGKERLADVALFLVDLRAHGEVLVDHVEYEFRKRMSYLDDYGGLVNDGDLRRRFRITLGRDWAALSFTTTWEALDPSTGDYRLAFDGALIWHGGSNDPLCVSLTPQLWGIHT